MKHSVPIELQTRINFANANSPEHGIFSKGGAVLLEGVERTGSLNRAAKDLGMAYSKAWTLMRSIEEQFDMKLINRNGARGSTVTEEGKELLACYLEIQKEVDEYAQKLFAKRFN